MKTKFLIGLLTLLAGAFALSGCGDSSEPQSASTVEQKNTMEVKTADEPVAPSLQHALAETTNVEQPIAAEVVEPVASAPVAVETAPVKPSGEQAYATCAGCHGVNGGGGVGPALKGKAADDLVAKLKAYRAGEQVGPMTVMMAPMAMSLTDEDIEVLVSYIVKF